MTSRRMSNDRDFDDVIVSHRSRDITERRSRLYQRAGDSAVAAAGSVRLPINTRTWLTNVLLLLAIVFDH